VEKRDVFEQMPLCSQSATSMYLPVLWSKKMSKQTVHILRWYDEEMSPREFPDRLRAVDDVMDLDIRRNNNDIKDAVHDVQSKLEIIGYHAKMALDRMPWWKTFLPYSLEKLAEERKKTPIRVIRNALRTDKRIEFYDYIFVAHLEGVLVQSKALLDSISQFYSFTFKREIKNFESRGKKLLSDLDKIPDESQSYKNTLKNLIKEAKIMWIDKVIKYRDQVAHHGQLRKFHCPTLRLTDSLHYRLDDVTPAYMPDGSNAKEFIEMVLTQTHRFSADMLRVFFERLREDAVKSSHTPKA
jgi:hypothetical protein